MSKVCVIIPMYNHNEMTRKCVDMTLANAGMSVDVLVVDDGSSEPFKYEAERVFVHRLDKNSDYTNAQNQGILWCKDRYEFLHFQNNDIEPEQDYIKVLYDAMQKYPRLGIASSVRIVPDHEPFNLELYGTDLIRGYQQMTNEDGLKQVKDDIIFTNWVPVCTSLVRLEMLRYIGILDPKMVRYCSDNDLCIRANFAGWNVAVLTKSRAIHRHGQTTGKDTSSAVERDQKILIEKIANLQYAELMKNMPLDAEQKLYGVSEFRVEKR